MVEQEFVCHYQHNGATWALNIHAHDFDDAATKLESLKKTIEVKGVLADTPNAQAHRKNCRSEAKANFSGAAPCWAKPDDAQRSGA